MATVLKSSNTIDFNRAKLELTPSLDDGGHGKSLSRLRYRLLSQLQTTLDISKLLELFLSELLDELFLDGVRYINEPEEILETTGRTSTHSCGYRLISRQDNLGELVFYRSTRFNEAELTSIEYLIGSLLCPLRNAIQYRQALTAAIVDPLTGAGNRIALSTTLERELALARRYRQPFSLLAIDIDKFKSVNDRFGHNAGDKALKKLVAILSEIHRNTDACFRFGGEEFVVVLNSTDTDGAMVIAERLRQGVERKRINYLEHSFRLTVSIGVTTWQTSDTAESLFERADRALYDIKESGGNQIKRL